jgi:hypothetical protein
MPDLVTDLAAAILDVPQPIGPRNQLMHSDGYGVAALRAPLRGNRKVNGN